MAKSTNSTDYAEKWARNLLASKNDIKAGVEAVKTAPGEKAAKAVDRYAEGVQEAVSSGKYERNCRAVSLSDWQNSTIEKLKNMDTGVRLAQPKMQTFADSFLPFIRNASERIQQMAKGGRANAIARIEANLDAMAQYKKSKGRG